MDQAAALIRDRAGYIKLNFDLITHWLSVNRIRLGGIVNVVRVDELADWCNGLGGFNGYIRVAVKTGQEVQAAATTEEGLGGKLVSYWSAGGT